MCLNRAESYDMRAKNHELARLRDVLFKIVEDEGKSPGEFTPLSPELYATLLRISQQTVGAPPDWEPQLIDRLGRLLCMRLPQPLAQPLPGAWSDKSPGTAPARLTPGSTEGLSWQRRWKPLRS